ncbi:MAG TPA: murein biosynthesis integral membrane protein MurJ [Deltaproteobacteria bacterium]|nr:MAG: murein biosynthesis integral membrane protein MurJ [Deltaproteobacteria bacterium GWA2_55_82]OGQ63370.1 MAG: murein biosynthesis integral membrane protein MurJ [Deltaproteobacteria bacterium RIFCSPLOWO2_02_FULL_55_12]OIJ73217.1 MAG: murein biosynthesis integral membrane protein MurJ [Deltaproteobacteria bacterium GWC2_55_46]HBG45523.1 murein biosynthesis integral membrane protein MurJ [Deltaproteobacteria bacterium]HCY10354.1 murein biosynthesis integral membrane protein MurJ [Deltaprot
MSHERRITGAASIISAATALSRVLGYIRDAVLAYVFGAGLLADAFFMAFRISNLLRRLVGEGALTSSFIPIFTEEMNSRSKEATRELVSSVFTIFAIILTILAVLGILFSKEIVSIMAPGFLADPEKFSLTVSLTRWMFPYMIFIGLMAIAMGVLNSYKHFTAPALAPVLFNLAIIASVFAIAPFISSPVYAIVAGVLVGGALQLFLQLPYLSRFGMFPGLSFKFNDSAIKKIFILMGPATFGIGVYQLNIFVTMWFASQLPEGAVSYLYYAGRLMELPLGVFGVSVTTAVLPSLSEHVAKKEWDAFKRSLSFAVRLVNFVMIPATIGLIILSYPIVEALFMRGEFTPQDAAATSVALYFYSAGLVPVAVSRILTSVFYSLKDTATPVWVAAIAFIFNTFFCFVLIGPLGHGGLALATTLASAVNCVMLFVILRLKFGRIGMKEMAWSALKASAASAVMGALVYFVAFKSIGVTGGLGKTFLLTACLSIGIVTYIIASKYMQVPELVFLKGFLSRRGKKAG